MDKIFNDTSSEAAAEFISCLKTSGIALYPTDTIYGLGCDALDRKAVSTLRTLLNRPDSKPFLVLAGSINIVEKKFDVKNSQDVIKKFWPGPVTILLKPLSKELNHLLGPSGKIGVRVPMDPFLQQTLSHWNGLLTSTSANMSGDSYCHDFETLKQLFAPKISLLIQRKNYLEKDPSALIEKTEDSWNILRQNKDFKLEKILGNL